MANSDDSRVSALAESAEAAEKSALETIGNDKVPAYANKAADTSNNNLDSTTQIVDDPSIEASEKTESWPAKFTNVKQAISPVESGEPSLTYRTIENSSAAPSTESDSDSESHEDSLPLPLSIRSLSFPLYILAWFSNLCSKKPFMFSTKTRAPKALEVNPNSVNEDLADGANPNSVNEDLADGGAEEFEGSTNAVNEDIPSASFMAVEKSMKEPLHVSSSAIEQDGLADAVDQIEDTDKAVENPMEQDDLSTADHKNDDTGKAVEGAEKNINEALSLQVGRVEESVGKYTRAIKSQVRSRLGDSFGEATRDFKYQMNGLEYEATSFKSEASTVEASVGEATTAYRSRVEALKNKFESFRI